MGKRILMALVALAVTVSFIGIVSATEIKAKEKTMGSVTKEKVEIKTDDATIKAKSKSRETAKGDELTKEKTKITTTDTKVKEKSKSLKSGDVTVEKSKIVAEPKHGATKKEVFTVKKINDNDPANASDNTVTVITAKNETKTLSVHKNMKINQLQKHKDKKVTIYSTYDIKAKDWIVDKLAAE